MLAGCIRCLVVFLFVNVTSNFAQEPGPASAGTAGCPVSRFKGEVVAGQGFAKEFGDGLVFRLAENPDPQVPGWTLRIHEKSDEEQENDFLMIATPPYRFWNPRYLDASYGYSAREAVAMDTREFSFVLNRKEFDRFAKAVETVLWSYGHSAKEVKDAEGVVLHAPRCQGELRLLDAKIEETAGPGRITWVKFEVELGPKGKVGK